MKKISCLLCLLLTIHFSYAQKEPVNKQKADTAKPKLQVVTNPIQVNANIVFAPGITLYERPNYQGRSAQFVKNAQDKFEFPFSLKHVSFRVPEGTIVYIKTCFEFPSENAYIRSQTDINLENICGIRTDESTLVQVAFNGISTEVHNNDCLHFAGSIEVRMMETAPGETAVETTMPAKFTSGRRSVIGARSHTFLNWPATQLRDRNFNAHRTNSRTVYNNNPVPELAYVAADFYGITKPEYMVSFYIGKSALRDGRAKVWLKTDLTSAHKNCDLCDDFSSSIKMESPGFENIPLNKIYDGSKIVDATHPYAVAGPYAAHGSRDRRAITASGGINKNFRVHLKITGL